MSVHYHVNFKKIGLMFVLLSVSLFAWHPKGFDKPILADLSPEEFRKTWEFGLEGDQELFSCTLESNDSRAGFDKLIEEAIKKKILKKLKIPDTDGICKMMNYTNILDDIMSFFQGDYYEATDQFVYDFIGKNNIGSSFDLGAFAQCKINLPDIKETGLAKFCRKDVNDTFSPMATLSALTVDGLGLPSFSGKEDEKSMKKVDDRKYPGGKTGKELFRNSGLSSNSPGGDDGGLLLGKAKEDPYGSTAVAFNSFDKPTIVLKTLAAMNSGTDEINGTLLPATKADSMDMEDEIVGIQTRMESNLNQFGDTLTRALEAEFADINMTLQHTYDHKPHLMSLSRYDYMEKNATAKLFRDKKSGLADIYKGIEEQAKARMASEMLLMTADPNYIANPSEARAALIKPSQRNKFRYAALIQQEKNKQLKLKYALEIKRKQQMVDLVKQQAAIRASMFRDSAARHELEHLLHKADESVKVEMKPTQPIK